jgi:hypothetical protein
MRPGQSTLPGRVFLESRVGDLAATDQGLCFFEYIRFVEMPTTRLSYNEGIVMMNRFFSVFLLSL